MILSPPASTRCAVLTLTAAAAIAGAMSTCLRRND
jgi:hypothetical protein